MGLFDKKKKDDFDSPVEEVSLKARPQTPVPGTVKTTGAAGAPPPPVAPAAAHTPPPPPQPRPRDEDEAAADFGINKTIELMRKLPADNVELVVTVVKTTLSALQVKVATIIKDADLKLKRIDGEVAGLRWEIADYEREIATRKDKVAALEADHAETTSVKERLILAEKLSEKPKGA